MTAISSNWTELLTEGLKKVYDTTDKKQPREFEKIFKKDTSKKRSEVFFRMAGLGMAVDKTEGGVPTYMDPTAGDNKTHTHKTIQAGFQVTRELYDDDLYGPIRDMPKRLNNSIYNKMEYDASALFADAFTGSTYAAWDTYALCYTAHTSLAGGTQSNIPAAHCDLSPTALKNALIALDSLKDDNGDPDPHQPKQLIVAPAGRFDANEILKSTNLAWEQSNTTNSIKDAVTPFVYHWLADTDSWFVLSDKHDLFFLLRKAPQFDPVPNSSGIDAKYIGWARYSFGFNEWRGVYGSSGG